MTHTQTAINGRYFLHEELGSGGMGTVYRATDRLTRDAVALKQVSTPSFYQDDSNNFRLSLAQEFKVLASLRHPNIITVLDYGFDEARAPYFTMEFLEDAPNLIETARDLPLPEQVELLIQLLRALTYLHRRGIVHRDLKPDNVLVVGGRVKVLDFGLAAAREQLFQEEGTIYGTPAYMAPEVIEGEKATEASDLYAVGMMAYQLFAGKHPFRTDNMAMVMMEIIKFAPNSHSLGLDAQLAAALDTALAKVPSARFGSADEMLRALARSIGRDDLLVETSAVRESFLQAAKFVGREAEFGQLVEALKGSVAGQGSGWLVGGESGVGKSRLIEELRTQALVEGTLVLRGQAISAGAAPYQMWRDVIRRLCLATEISIKEASVLKALAFDINLLLDQSVPNYPMLDPQATHDRLLQIICDIFARQTRPVVITLEDIHWASSESMAILKSLTEIVEDIPLLIIASYRDDERGDLPEQLPDMNPLKLHRLSDEAIAALSESMLGAAGREPAVLELIQRESEGNAFFIVEVVRALAEEVDQLDQIGSTPLPESVFAGSMQQILQHRLDRVPAHYCGLLYVAAVYGREINLQVMQSFEPELNLSRWLAACAEASVLEVQDMCWRFTHDKLREQLLKDMREDEQRFMHHQVAEAIESVYDGNDNYAAALAYHWQQAEDTSKALHYAKRAGHQALRSFAYEEAIKYFEQALAWLNKLPNTPERAQRELSLQIELGSTLIATKGYAAPEVEEIYARARVLCEHVGQSVQLFPVLWGLASFYIITAEFRLAHELAQRLMRIAEQEQDEILLLEAHRILGSILIFLSDLEGARQHMEAGLALYDRKNHDKHVHYYSTDPGVVCGAYLAWVLWITGYATEAKARMGQALDLANFLGHPHTLSLALNMAAFIFYEYGNKADVAQRYLEEAIPLAREHGFLYWSAQATIQRGSILVEQGKVAEGSAVLKQGMADYKATGACIGYPYFLTSLAKTYNATEQYEVGLALLDEALVRAEETGELFYNGEIFRVRGELLAGSADADPAAVEGCFRQAIAYARQSNAKSFELRAVISLYKFELQRGNSEAVRPMLEQVYGWFDGAVETADLEEARQLLATSRDAVFASGA